MSDGKQKKSDERFRDAVAGVLDWDKLRVFHAVAEAGSLTHAGESLRLSQSAVSRQISKLEESLGVPLFHRHARGLSLTEPGEILDKATREMISRLAITTAQIRDSRERPQGPLKITTTVAFGSIWLTPRIREFLSRYPDIEVSLVLSDDDLDLAMGEADVAIRMRAPREHDLIQRKLMTLRYMIYAAPEYLKKYGLLKTASDLDKHHLIVYGEDAAPPTDSLNWLLEVGSKTANRRRPLLKVNNIYGIFRAVQSGLGIGALPDYMNHEAGNLVEILPELEGPSFDVFFIYREELRQSKRINVLREFLLAKIREERI